MNPYRNLMSNTVLFGISTFGARFLTFLQTPFYTRVLTSAEYGVTDLLVLYSTQAFATDATVFKLGR